MIRWTIVGICVAYILAQVVIAFINGRIDITSDRIYSAWVLGCIMGIASGIAVGN